MKECRKCKIEQEEENFHICKTGKKGQIYRKPDCKPCDNKRKAEANMLKKFGMTPDDYNKMLEEQGHGCAICSTKEPRGQGRFHIDHCHSTGKIRGLLCAKCNVGLGQFDDNIEKMSSAIRYINNGT